jgi:hypothetical protein
VEPEYTPRAPAFDMTGKYPLIGVSSGSHIDGSRFPSFATQLDTKKLCDVFPMAGVTCVSARFKEIVESFEPDVHQFFPVELRRKDDTKYEEKYFILNACQMFDAVLMRHTEGARWRKEEAGALAANPPKMYFAEDGAVISTRKVAGRHLWRPQFMTGTGGNLFVSSQIASAIKTEKIKYLRFESVAERDEEWSFEENVQPVLDWLAHHPDSGVSINP